MIRSLRVRLMLGAAALAVLFMAALLPLVQGAFRKPWRTSSSSAWRPMPPP